LGEAGEVLGDGGLLPYSHPFQLLNI